MLERLAAWFLNTYVAEYIGNLNTDQLSIGLLSGAVELEKLTLKKDALHKLRLPIEVKAGYVGKLRLQVPVRYIKSQPWELQIDQLYLIACPPDLSKFDPEEKKEAVQARKRKKLAAMEQKWREEQQGKSSWFWSSFASSFTSTIAENLQVTINNIHIRYEDPEVGGASDPLVVGMIIDQLTSQSTNENWEHQFTAGGDKGYKLISLSNLSVYWDTELLEDLEGQDFMEAMYRKALSVKATQDMMSSSYFSGSVPATKHIVTPFSAEGRITLNRCPDPLKISDGPRVGVDIQVEEVPVVLSEYQFAKFVKLSDTFKLRLVSQKYRHLRPKCPIRGNPQVWWKFAMSCVTNDIKEAQKRLSLSFVLKRARQCVDYVSAYTEHLTQSAIEEESEVILEETEDELSYEEIAILRRVVMQRIERERALAEEAKRVADEEAKKQGLIQQWFPGWWTTTGEGETNSDDQANEQDESLKEIDEEELLDELGLEMDGNSKLLRDRIFVQLTFHLMKGSLQLVTDEEEGGEMGGVLGSQLLLEIELSSLLCHVDYRPRLKYGCLEVQLGGVSVFDHYQEESEFSTLVQPKDLKTVSSLPHSHSIKFSRTKSSGEVFQLQLIQQDVQTVRKYSLSLVTRPLDVVYNEETISRVKDFFLSSSSKGTETSQAAAKIAGLVGGVDHTLLDHVTVKLDISAPHVIIPKDFTDRVTPMVVVDLGHLTFESKSDWSEEAVDSSEVLVDEGEGTEGSIDIDSDIDEDDEFVTPPSTPPLESASQTVSPSELASALSNRPHPLVERKAQKLTKVKEYVLQLSEIQVLVGELSLVQSALASGRGSLHLLDQFSLIVHIKRQKIDSAQISIIANLPLLHFHLDEEKIHTLLSCFTSPHESTNKKSLTSQISSLRMDRSMYFSFTDNRPSQASSSVYESALNFADESCDTHVTTDSSHVIADSSHDGHVTSKRSAKTRSNSIRHLSADVTAVKLVQAQININEVKLDLHSNKHCVTELKVLGVRAGATKRLYDMSARLIIEDMFVVDKLQEYGPQYELILCSNGHHLFSDSPTPRKKAASPQDEDVFSSTLPFLINVSLLNLSSLSPDHPSVMVADQGGGYTAYSNGQVIRKLTLQCTAVDLIANQKTIVELIGFAQRAIPSHVLSNSKTTPTETTPTRSYKQDSVEATTATARATPTQTEISIELEKLSIRTLRGRRGKEAESPASSLLATSFEFLGLGVQASFGAEINIDGYMEGFRITDLTSRGKLYPNIVSVGTCREGRDVDMITTMMTSYDSLQKMSDCLRFSICRIKRPSPTPSSSHAPSSCPTPLFDIHVSAHVPSILYTHSVSFVREMQLFAVDFLRYFDDVTNSVKSAAIGVAKGLVREKSQLAKRLSHLSSTLRGHYSVSVEGEELEETDVGVFGGEADRVLVDILVKSPVVVLPSSMSSENTLVFHLGEISINNCYSNKENETQIEEPESEFVLSSREVDRLTVKVTNVTLHSSHDQASRDWLVSEVRDEMPSVSGRWRKVLTETSFVFQVERAVGDGSGQSTPATGDDDAPSVEQVDVMFHCLCSNSVLVSLPNEVFTQIKHTIAHGIYEPVLQTGLPFTPTKGNPVRSRRSQNAEKLPKMFARFSLSRLSIETSHLIGSEEKNIVFISFDDFLARCHKTTPHHTHFDLALKSVIIEDLLQTNESYRYILSSTIKPLPFSSPVSTPSSSLFSHHGMGISPHSLLPLTKLISSPKPPRLSFSPLRSFNPFSETPPPSNRNDGGNGTTTPPADVSASSSVTDVQGVVSIRGVFVTEECPDFSTRYNGISLNVDISFSTVYLIVNLQTWVLLFDYLGIGVPTPPSSPTTTTTETTPTFKFAPPPTASVGDGLEMYSLRPDGSVYIAPQDKPVMETGQAGFGGAPQRLSPEKMEPLRSTVWGVEGKFSAQVSLKVQSLSVTFNKPEHPLARGTASGLKAEVTLSQGNVRLIGSLGQASLIDLTETGAYYRERLTTTGDQALSFDVFKFGRRDPNLERPYDISATAQVSAIKYLHTMRFLKEIIAFCQHFPQLIDAFQRMKAVSRGHLFYVPDRKPRILLEIKADGPMILIPKHAFSPEIMGGVIKRLTVCNRFLYDGENGTLSQMSGRGVNAHSSVPRTQSTPERLSSTENSFNGVGRGWLTHDHAHSGSFLARSKAEEDKEVIEDFLSHQGPCLLDCIELILADVDVFSARKRPLRLDVSLQDGYQYLIERDEGQLLKERGTLKLQIERNLYEDFCRSVPDIHIDGTLLAVHLMLDKRQLENIKGLIDMNLGEHIDEFEKPSSVIHDPVVQPIVAAVWTGFRFHIKFVEVKLEFLQSRAASFTPGTTPTATPTTPKATPFTLNQSLALFDLQLSEFAFEARSDQSKTVDFTTQAVIVHDTRYEGFDLSEKPNVFEDVLKSRYAYTPTDSLQVELHVSFSPTAIKASILLNGLRLIGVVNLLMELKQFVIDKLPEDDINESTETFLVEDVDYETEQAMSPILNTLKNSMKTPIKEEKKPDRDVKVSLSITETDLVVVEDLTNPTSNAVVMKGTVVLNFHSPPSIKGPSTLHCSIDGLELFSCCVSHEDDTALSILDPMSIGVELKPLDTPTNEGGSHMLEFDVRQLNVRLSFNDIKMFLAILQNLQLTTPGEKRDGLVQSTRAPLTEVNDQLVKRLLPLGFTRTAILKELSRSDNDVNMAALQLLEEEKRMREKEESEKKMKLKSLEVVMGSLNIYLIDDSLNHDVPLLEVSLSSLQATNQIAAGLEGNAMTTLSLDYYNRNISAWEPIVEPWKVQLLWRKITHFSTDIDTNEKPSRLSLSMTSPEQLNVNVTSSFLLLLKETQTSWSSDFKMADKTAQKAKEKQLLKIHRHDNKQRAGEEDKPTSNVQQGLAFLHSVRFISQSRQRTKFIPFALKNSTGLHLSFATLTSLPSRILFNPLTLLQSPNEPRPSLGVEPDASTLAQWIEVQPDEEKPFDFVSRQKIRHKDTRAFLIHQLRVKVKGYDEITVPISVDKIGIFFRDVHQSDGRGQIRLYFAISLRDTRKCVNVRSGLVISNTLELPMEIKLDPPSHEKRSSVGLPVIPPAGFAAVPLHLTDWNIRVRPQGWGLKFCSRPLSWEHASRVPTSDLRLCEAIGDTERPPFRFCVEVKQDVYLTSSTSNTPGHTISLRPVFTVSNLLPYGFHFSYLGKEKFIPHDQDVPIHNVNSMRPVLFSISKLEGFDFSEDCTVSIEEVGVIKSLVVRDKAHRPLNLCVSIELVAKGSLKISIWCPYWLINRTGLPLVFVSQGGDSSGDIAAGQFEEHETASEVSPLLFSYSEDDLLQKCQVRLGKGYGEGYPNWSSSFRMLRDGGVLRLFVRRGKGRPDRECQIGMEIKKGNGRYQVTRLVTFVARFQLENRTSFRLAYLQRHLVTSREKDLLYVDKDDPVILPGAVMAFHWPRADLDQLLCIKVCDLTDSYWSGGFPLEQDKSFHINMRCSYGRSVFIRCEVLQRGATYHVIFSDASDYPPPFKLENLSQITVCCYQQSIVQQHQCTVLNPGQSVPYSWDEVTLPEILCVHIRGVSEPRPFDLSSFGPQGKVYYESYFYIVATETGTDQSDSTKSRSELVLDVPQGKAVILTRKNLERRSQLWRMTAAGQLVHINSSTSSSNYVLDLAEHLPEGSYRGNRLIPLVVSKVNSKSTSTQTWEFQDGRLVLSNHPYLCVQCRHGYESMVEGADAVIGRVGGKEREWFHRLKKSPGSGVLSVSMVPDGPTRVLRITDESKKYTFSTVQDDWIIVERGLMALVKVPEEDPTLEESENKTELSVSLSLEKGISVSLINSVPEELILASATGVRVEFVSTAVHQCLNATVQYIQVDNQMSGGYNPIVIFPTPSAVGQLDMNYPVISCFIERLPHNSPLAIVFRTVDVKIKQLNLLLEEKLLFRIIQWAGIGNRSDRDMSTSNELLVPSGVHWGHSSLPSRQLYIEQLSISKTELLVSMHTTSQLPEDLLRIKKQLGFPLVQFESPILLEGFRKSHMLGTPLLFVDAIAKHYKKVVQGQAVTILGSVDFLGNPMGLINDVASGIHGMIAAQPDVVGLVRDVAHGMSDTTSKLTGTVSHVLGHATGDSSFQEEREQNLESCQTSGDHFKAGLINLTSGIFGGMTSILTQPYKGAVEEGVGGFIWGIGKGVVGTVAKPVAGLLDFASGTSAALRETMSRVSRHMPQPMRLRRCCVGRTGALTCYSVQLARGQEYLLRLNDGDINEKLVGYEKFSTGSLKGEMRVIVSSQCLYFFEDSPPDLSSLDTLIKLDQLVECRSTQAKTTIPTVLLVLSIRDRDEVSSQEGALIHAKKYKCLNESIARKIAQLINYAKNLHNEEKMIVRTPRLQNEIIW